MITFTYFQTFKYLPSANFQTNIMNAQNNKFDTAKFGHNNFLQNKSSITFKYLLVYQKSEKNSNEETLRKKNVTSGIGSKKERVIFSRDIDHIHVKI